MKTTDFNTQLTSSKLHENLEKQFGAKVNLEKYDREQLEDIRNKLRTRIFQQEGTAGVNDLLTNETYQKDKAMLELLNTRIKEMLGEQMKKLRDTIDQLNENKKGVKTVKKSKGSKGADQDGDGDKDFADVMSARMQASGKSKAAANAAVKNKPYNKESKVEEAFPVPGETKEKTTGKFDKKKTSTGTVYTKKAEKADDKKSKKDDDLEEAKAHAKDCDCKECMAVYERDEGKHNNKTTGFKALAKKAGGGEKGAKIAGAQRQKMKKAGQLEESNFRHNVRFVNESINWLLSEDEEGKAKAITAAGDIVNDYTSWMQRVGQYQTKSMIELADAIRADFGAAEAEAFKGAVGPALSATLEVLTQQREAVSNAVAVLAGEAAPEEPMGAEPGMDAGMDAGMPPAAPDEMNPEAGADLGDEFAAADASSSNREMRESRVERRARKLAESHSIIAKLSR